MTTKEESEVRYEIKMPKAMAEELKDHLLKDRSKEQMAVALCGVAQLGDTVRLLGRHLILMPPEAFAHQSAVSLNLSQEVQSHVLRLAAREGLSQVDFHTHPGSSSTVGFSGTDDHSERALAEYLSKRIPGTLYGSVVLNGAASAARIWDVRHGCALPVRMPAPDFENPMLPLARGGQSGPALNGRFDRQVRAFGAEFQRRLSGLKVGVVGLGGLGSIIVEQLGRLGVRDWVLVDPDIVEATNLNRLLGATLEDVEEETPKVEAAARNLRLVDPENSVTALRCSVFAPRALKTLKECDLIVAATDNDASRLVLNALACQYLIPLVHVGVNLEPGSGGSFEDISAEVAIPPLGSWCLLCSGIISSQRAGWDLAIAEEREQLIQRGYLKDVPAPAVYHLNGVAASLAVAEIHNLLWQYKPRQEYLVYRELSGELMSVQVPKGEGCVHCSPEGILGLGDLAPLWTPRRSPQLGGRIPAALADSSEDPIQDAVEA